MSLIELLIALVVLATISALGWSGVRRYRSAAVLEGTARAVTSQLVLARSLAVSRRETIRLLVDDGFVQLLASDGTSLSSLATGRGTDLPVDSLRIRPRTIRFNARGHAGAGSVYMWLDGRGVRLVCNFLGRVRREAIPAP
jgi:type II secretory pathway pseudopilin PulG